MRKILFICLVLSFFVSPFLEVVGNGCHGDDIGHICTLHDDIEAHEQSFGHCHSCHVNIDVPKVSFFRVVYNNKKEFVPRVSELLLSFDIHNSLIRPPIA